VKYTGGLGYCWFFFYKPALIVLFLKSRFGLDNLPWRQFVAIKNQDL
jgi:hypothetical protein